MKYRCIFVLVISLHWALDAGGEPLLVKSYYGNYKTDRKVCGFPAKSLTGPVKKEWVSPVPKKKYRIGVLLPHLKDSYWVAANYGITSYAKQLGLELVVYSAGAYINLGNQKRQLFDLAKKSHVDGIILAAVNLKKMDIFVEDVTKAGVPVIGLINDIRAPTIKAKAMVSYFDAGYLAGQYVIEDSRQKSIGVAFLPGPAKSGWAENMYRGFMKAIKDLKAPGQTITVLPPVYGDSRPDVQRMRLRIVLSKNGHRKIDYIVANAVGAAEAVHFLKKHRKSYADTKVVSTYLTSSLYDYIKKGDIKAAPYDQPLVMCRLALDMMVKLLNGQQAGKDFPFRAGPEFLMITTDNIDKYSYESLFGHRDYKPRVDQWKK